MRKIASADSAAAIVALIDDVDRISDDYVTGIFVRQVKAITAQTMDLEGINLLKSKFVDYRMNAIYCPQNTALRAAVFTQIALTQDVEFSNVGNIIEIIDEQSDPKTIDSLIDKIKVLISKTTDPKELSFFKSKFVDGNLGSTSSEQDNELKVAVLKQIKQIDMPFITAADSATAITALINKVDQMNDDIVTAAFVEQVKAVVAKTTDLEELNLLKSKFVDGNLGSTSSEQDNELKVAVLKQIKQIDQSIITADSAAAIIVLADDIDQLNDADITAAFIEQIKAVVAKTTDPEELDLLKSKFVDGNLGSTSSEQDKELRGAVLKQIKQIDQSIITADSADAIVQLVEDIDQINDADITAAFIERVKAVVAKITDLEEIHLLKSQFVSSNMRATSSEQDEVLKVAVLKQIIALTDSINFLRYVEPDVREIDVDELSEAFADKLASFSK